MGAAHVFNGREADVAASIREVTKGHGFSAAFDFVGSDANLTWLSAAPPPSAR